MKKKETESYITISSVIINYNTFPITHHQIHIYIYDLKTQMTVQQEMILHPPCLVSLQNGKAEYKFEVRWMVYGIDFAVVSIWFSL